MNDPGFVVLILMVVIIAQLGVIYALVSRLMTQAGQARMKPFDAFPDIDKPSNQPVEKIRKVTGSHKVTP